MTGQQRSSISARRNGLLQIGWEISGFIDGAKIFYLATIDGDQPKSRPLEGHHLLDGGGKEVRTFE